MSSVDSVPTIVANEGFDAASDAMALRNAMKGLGTDEETIIKVLGSRTNLQRTEIAAKFKLAFEKELDEVLDSELHGEFSRVCRCLASPLTTLLAHELNRAMDRPGTDEDILIEILCSRSNLEIRQIESEYERLFSRTLENHITSDTSGDFRTLLLMLLKAQRDEPHVKPRKEDPDDPQSSRMAAAPANEERAKRQAEQLYAAGEGRLGTGEKEFNLVFSSQSYDQLRLTVAAYEKLYGHSLESAVRSETHGDYQRLLVAIVALANDPAAFFAERFRKALRGLGTSDKSLTRLIVSRAEIDLGTICRRYTELYERDLREDVASDTSGHYRQLLLQFFGES